MTETLHPTVAAVTERITARSEARRAAYLERGEAARRRGPGRGKLSCSNWAHAFAASPAIDKLRALDPAAPNIAIVSAYNDMLSAHQPFEHYPDILREAARKAGATAQVAGGVPAMCDGVTQGQPGMELSLFSRDLIAMSTAVALTHDAFDAVLCLGVCDKIVPGLLIGALSFGHLPTIFVPAGPMTSGLPNSEKSRVRGLYAQGKVGREALLEAESRSYHGPGTCTFYGTANSNQMLMEMMGLHLPGAAFVNPDTPLRRALTAEAARRGAAIVAGAEYTPIGQMIDARAIVNGVVGLMATGGSTNHAIHLVAIAAAAGLELTWDDLDDLSRVTPLLARVYPNGEADVNHFHAAGGMAFVVRQLLDHGFAHADVTTIAGRGLRAYQTEPFLDTDGGLVWREGALTSLDPNILRPVEDPFQPEGGLRLLTGNLGRSVIKVSAVAPRHRIVEAPAIVFDDQDDVLAAFKRGELERDFIAVVRFQGPVSNGMPELHSLSPTLGLLQDRGFKVGLVTDGRMSGASGKTPAAIHLTPEAACGGLIGRLQTGDVIRLDAEAGGLDVLVDDAVLQARQPAELRRGTDGFGRELFDHFRHAVGSAEAGASVFARGAPNSYARDL